jgi:Uma2 family endonuclease
MTGRADLRPQPVKLTYDDYVTLPDDGRRYEILDGELAVSPSPTSIHQFVSHNLEFLLSAWVRAQRLGRVWDAPLDLILEPTVVMQPDIFFIANEHSSIVTRRGVEGAPDLVIEILSDSTAARDRGIKLQIYARHRVARYWIVDTEQRTIEVHALRGSAYEVLATYSGTEVAHLDVPDGFVLPLSEVWPEETAPPSAAQ